LIEVIIIDDFDKQNFKAGNNQKVIYWQGYSRNNDNYISILNLVESDSDNIRNIYLNWINNLGAIEIKRDLPLHKYLRLRDKYSFWWQTYFVEKSNYEHSTQINDAIKLITFQIWLKNQDVKKIRLLTKNKMLADALEELSFRKNISFVLERNFFYLSKFSFKRLFYKLIPHEFQAFIWLLRKVNYSFSRKCIDLKNFKLNDADVVFVDYFCNFNSESLSRGIFSSNYWFDLNQMLTQNSIRSNWIHLSINFNKNENLFSKNNNINRSFKLFNKNSKDLENHTLLDSFISLNVLKLAILDWITLRKKCRNLDKRFQNTRIEDLNLFHLYKDEWKESFRGVSSISTILDFNLFSEVFKNIKSEPKLIYLFENQPWEFAMIQAWKEIQKGQIIGYVHSSICYWDLRKFFHKNTFINNQFPSPDLYAMNGKLSQDVFESNHIIKEKIIKIEATRYQYLSDYKSIDHKEKKYLKKNKKKVFNLLVVCDYNFYYTKKQLNIISSLEEMTLKNFLIKIKPHPANIRDFKNLSIDKHTITFDPLSSLINNIDLVFLSSTTSAALEFYALGIDIVCLLDHKNLNMSPLRNKRDVKFLSNVTDFKYYLENYKPSRFKRSVEDIFYLNKNLSMWNDLLSKK